MFGYGKFPASKGKGLGLIVVCLGASLGEGEAGAKVRLFDTQVEHSARAGKTLPHCHSACPQVFPCFGTQCS